MDYEEIRTNVSKNLIILRKRAGMTQVEFGEKFSFSDKTISKWESGLSIPDVATLQLIATEFNTTIDALIKSDGIEDQTETQNSKAFNYNTFQKCCILLLLLAFVWSIAGLGYVFISEFFKKLLWPIFLWAIPISSMIISKFNSSTIKSFVVKVASYSITNWGILIASYYSFLMYNISFTPIFFLGIPIQLLIILSAITTKWQGGVRRFKKHKDRTNNENKQIQASEEKTE